MNNIFDYGFQMSKNGTKVVTYEAVGTEPEKDIFDFMYFVAQQHEKYIVNIFDKKSMKLSHKYTHCIPKNSEEALAFCKDKECTFGMTYFCGVKDGFTTGFSIIKPHMAEALVLSAFEDESYVDIEEKMRELLSKFSEWRHNV